MMSAGESEFRKRLFWFVLLLIAAVAFCMLVFA
jgi:hypothetical protein